MGREPVGRIEEIAEATTEFREWPLTEKVP
jgi:hypothetical protein